MCTMIVKQVEIDGSGKGTTGWFPVRQANVSFDHPFHAPLEHALNIGFLAFDSTCTSVTEVDFPIDIALYRSGSFAISEHRFAQNELQEASEWWHTRLSELVKDVPSNWAKKFFSKSEAAHS